MRKYVIGFIFGIILSSVSLVLASNSITATIFPAKYVFNDKVVTLPEGYKTLNFEGRTYVPVRFIGENLNAVITYDGATKTIRVENRFSLLSIDTPLKARINKVTKLNSGSEIIGELYAGQDYWDQLHDSKFEVESGTNVEISAYISFYDESGRNIDFVPVKTTMLTKGDQIKEFNVVTNKDLTDYSFATLEHVGPIPFFMMLPPDINVADIEGRLGVGDLKMLTQETYTKIQVSLAFLKKGKFKAEGILTFYDDSNNKVGTAVIDTVGSGEKDVSIDNYTQIYKYETVGIGDFSNVSKYTLTLKTFTPID